MDVCAAHYYPQRAAGQMVAAITPPRTPALDGVELGMSRAQVEAQLGRALGRRECLERYDIPVCSSCMTRECDRVGFGVYAGPVVVLYGPAGVFRVQGSRLRLPDGRSLREGERWRGQLGHLQGKRGDRLFFPSVYLTVDPKDTVGNLTLYHPWLCPDRDCGWKAKWWLAPN